MFKAIIATTALIVGSWNPVSAMPRVNANNYHLDCNQSGKYKFFGVLSTPDSTKNSDRLFFYKDGTVSTENIMGGISIGSYNEIPNTQDVRVTLEGQSAIIAGLKSKKCDSHF